MNIWIKLILFCILGWIIIIVLTLGVLILIPSDDRALCAEDNICKENLEINTQYGRIIVNKENCLKYNGKWDEKRMYCHFEYKN